MRLISRLRNLTRGALIGIIVALLIVEGGLAWAGWQAVNAHRPTALVAPTPTRTPAVRPDSYSGTPQPTPEPVQTPVTTPLDRPAGPDVTGGNLAQVAAFFDAEEAMGFVEKLANPAWGGRVSGSPGSQAAGEWIAEKFQEYGLQPAGTDGYFQPFSAPYADVTAVPTFTVTTAAGTIYDNMTFRQDFAFVWGGYAGGGGADGRVFWVNEGTADDYKGVDVTGQVVFASAAASEEVLRQAVEHGASGLLLLTNNSSQITMWRTYREAPLLPKSLPTLYVSRDAAAVLLGGSGYSVDDLTILHWAVELPTSAHFEVQMDEPGEAAVRNVLGVIPGSDPALRDQVLILGAHYDHVGADPNGDIYEGANDDASGVAALLEIAASWQRAGFTPASTVLFAAWDCEEQGLFGSIYYVQHPRYPLESTIGMIQLDMVGLASDGVITMAGYTSTVGRQLQASAKIFGVETREVSFQGGSDHVPFVQARVPAAMLIWDDGDVPYYHTPMDTPDTLQPERLREAGAITSHAAMVLTTVEPHLKALAETQAKAIRSGDADAYAATLDPEDAALLQAGRDWLTSRAVAARSDYTVTVGPIQVGADTATVDISASTADQQGRKTTMGSYPLRLVRRGAEWYATWPWSDQIVGDYVGVNAVVSGDTANSWAQAVDNAFAKLGPALGLANPRPIELNAYPNDSALAWLAGPGDGRTTSPLPGFQVSQTASPTSTAVSLILSEMDLPDGQGAWLRTGLNEWVKALDDPAVREQQAEQFAPSLDSSITAADVMTRTTLGTNDTGPAWSLVGYLINEYGQAGLLALCHAWGQTGSQQGAFVALGSTPEGFASAWETDVLSPLVEARSGIDALLRQREAAVMSGDKASFMATVDPNDATFHSEEAHWFDDLAKNPVQSYLLSARVLSVESGRTVARLDQRATLGDGSTSAVSDYDAVFRQVDGSWVLSGPDWNAQESEHFVVRYTSAPPEIVSQVLDAAERAYGQVTADLDYLPASRTEIKLYDDDAAMRSSILLSLPSWVRGWYEPDEAIKLSPRVWAEPVQGRQWDATLRVWVTPTSPTSSQPSDLVPVIAHEFTHRALFDMGIQLSWLHEGVAAFEGMRADPANSSSTRNEYTSAVREALRMRRLFDWANMPAWDEVNNAQTTLFYGQSWSLVNEFAQDFGLPGLNRLLRSVGAGQTFERAFAASTGKTFSEWQPTWEESVQLGGVPEEFIRWSQGFDADQALKTVERLASPEYAGRRAGSAGAEEAARWIASQMELLGLQPAAPDGTFFQPLTILYSELTDTPTLDFRNPDTGETLSLPYRDGFRELLGGLAGGGEATAEVVWLPDGYADGMRLGGRVVVKMQESSADGEAQLAAEHGAGGLILVTKDAYVSMLERVLPTAVPDGQTVPVVQIRDDTWRQLIALAGLTVQQINNAQSSTLLALTAHVSVPYEPVHNATALNVIGKIPGTDPSAAPLLIAARYDGVGALPDGTLYPGANGAASGIGVMLDVARVLQNSGYQPVRSIYFIAWGAEEAALASSRYYAENPAVPLDQTMGLIDLDKVGAARSYYLNIEGQDNPDGSLVFDLQLAADLLQRRVSPEKYQGGNSHEAFHNAGVPSVLLFWPDADNINTPQDTPESLNLQKLTTTGETLTLAAMMLGQ